MQHIVRSVAFAGHSHHNFATGCQDKCVRLFDVNCPDADPTVMNALPASVRCLKWIQEDNILLGEIRASFCQQLPLAPFRW